MVNKCVCIMIMYSSLYQIHCDTLLFGCGFLHSSEVRTHLCGVSLGLTLVAGTGQPLYVSLLNLHLKVSLHALTAVRVITRKEAHAQQAQLLHEAHVACKESAAEDKLPLSLVVLHNGGKEEALGANVLDGSLITTSRRLNVTITDADILRSQTAVTVLIRQDM